MRLLFVLISAFAILSCNKSQDDVISYVDPFIGTDGIVHTFPGATVPFGMVQLSPDGDTKGWNWCSGYHSSDSSLMGFSHTHLSGTGWSDLGDILVMPTIGEIKFDPGKKSDPDSGFRSRISHDSDNEKATAGYYMVNLLDYDIKAELTASPRVGFHRYTFPKSDSANIIFDPTNKIFGSTLNSSVRVVSDTQIEGCSYSNGWGGKRYTYFFATFSKPFVSHVIQEGHAIHQGEGSEMNKIALTFSTSEGEQIEVKVAISQVDESGAKANYQAEAAIIDFDAAHRNAVALWREKLSKYEFETDDIATKRMLYTGLYHAMIQPNLSQDVDGRYWALGKVMKADGFTNYSTFSLWDTHRAVHPLFNITEHEANANFVNSLISRYENGGKIPLWELCGYDNTCMISYPAVATISEAIVKNIGGIDANKALEAMIHTSNSDYHSSSDGESGVEYYNSIGYVPAGIGSSVSKTMENSYYDWAIAQVAKKLGNKEVEQEYLNRSLRFMNHYDSASQLMMPKDSTGEFVEVDMRDWESLKPHYVSGNIWAYSYFYPHALAEVAQAMGGYSSFVESMDRIISTPLDMKGDLHVDLSGFIGQYGHGDEPGHQFAYLYTQAGEPHKAAKLINEVTQMYYNDSRAGMPNNDDCGQMSAWHIFSSMGFYPLSQASGEYVIGAPMIDGAKIKTETGNTFTMKANNLSSKNIYIQSATLNGEPLKRGYITHDEIMSGATLIFEMGSEPVNFF
ncbi:MAG: GH92 family glycosyl hydrolase [Rikenellaceae bacterium]